MRIIDQGTTITAGPEMQMEKPNAVTPRGSQNSTSRSRHSQTRKKSSRDSRSDYNNQTRVRDGSSRNIYDYQIMSNSKGRRY